MEKKLLGLSLYLFGIFAFATGSVIIVKIQNHKKLGWIGCGLLTLGLASVFASFGCLGD